MRDGFHQIKMHQDDTKYFSFATPDRQFEYNTLPFCSATRPLNFRNISYKSFNRLLEQIVYIDDILVATDSVDEI